MHDRVEIVGPAVVVRGREGVGDEVVEGFTAGWGDEGGAFVGEGLGGGGVAAG